jgi:hypothetical protein
MRIHNALMLYRKVTEMREIHIQVVERKPRRSDAGIRHTDTQRKVRWSKMKSILKSRYRRVKRLHAQNSGRTIKRKCRRVRGAPLSLCEWHSPCEGMISIIELARVSCQLKPRRRRGVTGEGGGRYSICHPASARPCGCVIEDEHLGIRIVSPSLVLLAQVAL